MISVNINISQFHHAPSFKAWAGVMERIKVVDVGANPIDGDPHYAGWLKTGDADVVGFDSNPGSLEGLNARKGPHETYLPYAIADGKQRILHVTACQGMSSIFTPNRQVLNLFSGFPLWGHVMSAEPIETKRLDDVPEAKGVEYIKLDIQGASLLALSHAKECLKTALVVEAEVEFMPIYEGQPLFSDVELFMREQGFQFHRFYELASRMMTPLTDPNDKFAGMSQLLWSDAIFIRDMTKLDNLTDEQLLKMAIILHDCYRSFDVVARLLTMYDRRTQKNLMPTYFQGMMAWRNANPMPQAMVA